MCVRMCARANEMDDWTLSAEEKVRWREIYSVCVKLLPKDLCKTGQRCSMVYDIRARRPRAERMENSKGDLNARYGVRKRTQKGKKRMA